MCGIAGVFRFDQRPVSFVTLKQMTDAIYHRGPDDEGIYVDGTLGLGHRRLSVIDLSNAGRQPMQSTCGRYILTYNGEIYNFRELRAELQSRGHCFRSNTDSEVVLYAFVEWRQACVKKFNGMFAFAIWDKQEKELFLARDRYGIKPLYYYQSRNAFVCGSEIKALIASGEYETQIDEDALFEYLNFQNFFTNRSLFKNVYILKPATTLTIKSNGYKVFDQYWDFHFCDDIKESEAEIIDKLDYLFRQSVNRQLISDVGVNAYLSGGIDSGAITMLAAQQCSNMKTFTVGFDLSSASGIEQCFDERQQAEYLSYQAKTEHYEMILKAGDMERCISKLVWHMEEPRVGQCYPNFYAAKLASSFGKVVLAGTGGDELFAGYPWRYCQAPKGSSFDQYIDHYYAYWQRLLSDKELTNLFNPLREKISTVSCRDIFKHIFPSSLRLDKGQYINHSLYLEAKTFLHGLLVVEDKLSMAHSLEARVPMLDNDFVDYAMHVPVSHNLQGQLQTQRVDENSVNKKSTAQGMIGKCALRKLFGRYIPSNISQYKKQGFSAPDASWFRGESIDYVRSVVDDRANVLYDYIDYASLQNLIKQHLTGKKNRRLLVWSTLYLSEWIKQFNVKKINKNHFSDVGVEV